MKEKKVLFKKMEKEEKESLGEGGLLTLQK